MEAIASPMGIELTESIAVYIRAKFKSRLAGTATRVAFPNNWSLRLLQECDHLVNVLAVAYQNKKTTSWGVESYVAYLADTSPKSTGQNGRLEERIRATYPPLHGSGSETYETQPFVVIDLHGNILVWYLPASLLQTRQITMWQSLKTIENSLTVQHKSSSWRINGTHYTDPENCRIRPGTVSVAPAWYQQAHAKSHSMEVSAVLRKDQGLQWIQQIKESSALIGAVLAIIHPVLYEAGIRAMRTIASKPEIVDKRENLPKILNAWSAPFTGLSVMNNRQTPVHRDNGGDYCSMDLLATVGPYVDGIMELPGLGYKMKYNSGTLVALCGRVIAHGATALGERACFAYYMRENVMRTLQNTEPEWANVDVIDRL